MTRETRPGLLPDIPSLRTRVVGLLVLLLVLASTSFGAGHIHGSWLPGHSATQVSGTSLAVPVAGGDLDCPLCLTMHAALPVAATLPRFAASEQRAFAVSGRERGRQVLVHFPSFSRPPPAATV